MRSDGRPRLVSTQPCLCSSSRSKLAGTYSPRDARSHNTWATLSCYVTSISSPVAKTSHMAELAPRSGVDWQACCEKALQSLRKTASMGGGARLGAISKLPQARMDFSWKETKAKTDVINACIYFAWENRKENKDVSRTSIISYL